MTPDKDVGNRARRMPWRIVMLACAAIAVIALSQTYDLPKLLSDALNWIESRGAVGAIVFVGLYVVATVLAFPASLLTLGAGAVYGLGLGFVLVSMSATIGATAAFLIARYAARDWIGRRIAGNPRFKALDDGVAEEGWKIVFLTRLSPLFPFNLQNYGYGLTRIDALHYALASWIGMMPGTLMYVYIGHAAGSLATASAQDAPRSPAQWMLLAIGLGATVAVTVFVTRLAQRKLSSVSHVETGIDQG